MNQNSALLIIDVQVGLFMGEKYGGPKIYNSDQLLKNISNLANIARTSNTPVIYIQHTGPDDSIAGKGKPAWEIHPQIKPQISDIVILKNHADAFYETELNQTLQSKHISRLFVTGLQTEYCVDTTLRRAFSLGYKITLVSDGHSTFDSDILSASQIIEHHNGTLSGKNPYAEKFADLMKTEEIRF